MYSYSSVVYMNEICCARPPVLSAERGFYVLLCLIKKHIWILLIFYKTYLDFKNINKTYLFLKINNKYINENVYFNYALIIGNNHKLTKMRAYQSHFCREILQNRQYRVKRILFLIYLLYSCFL